MGRMASIAKGLPLCCCAMIPSGLSTIHEKVGLPTIVADPFGRMKITSKAKGQMVENEAPGLMIACGLAMRSFD